MADCNPRTEDGFGHHRCSSRMQCVTGEIEVIACVTRRAGGAGGGERRARSGSSVGAVGVGRSGSSAAVNIKQCSR